MRKVFRWQAFLAAVALVLTTLPASAASPSDQAVDRASTLKIALNAPISAPDNMNIYAPGGNISNGIHELVYEYLFYQNLQTGEPRHVLASL